MKSSLIRTPKNARSNTRSIRRKPTVCKVCGDSALYSYYGEVVCHSCKIFFKRNADKSQRNLRCNSNSSCEINMNTRQQCSYCRLEKCFQVGMQIQMIRSPRTKKNNTCPKNQLISNATYTTLTEQSGLLPTSNLVRRDLSKFSRDEWNLLSNILHCFDEYIGHSFTQDFIKQQNALHPKLRFRCEPVRDFITSSMNNVQVVVEKNRNFLSLSSDDRRILLQSTVEYTANVGGLFLLRYHQLFHHPSYYRTVEIMFGPSAIAFIKYITDRLDPDETFIKLIISLLSFSTINYTDFTRIDMSHLHDIRRIISIQDMYASLVWKYLLYRYDYKQVVKRFSNLIHCLIYEVDAIREAHQSNQLGQIIDSVIEQTKQTNIS